MNKIYKLSGSTLSAWVGTTDLVVEETADGNIYERYVVTDNASWKTTGDRLFAVGYNRERLDRFIKQNPDIIIEEMSEEDLFSLIL